MKIGVPKEIKTLEFRVGMTPAGVRELVHDGHEVMVQTGAGGGIDMSDADYVGAGATVVETPEEIFAAADMIVKVKEPQPNECAMLREDQVLFTYLHLAADADQTKALVESGCTAIAYETIQEEDGRLPVLRTMSEVAGRMAPQLASTYLQSNHGGRGVLLSGVPGIPAARVVILGGGVLGINAARTFLGLGADVSVLDRSLEIHTGTFNRMARNISLFIQNDCFGAGCTHVYPAAERLGCRHSRVVSLFSVFPDTFPWP